MKNESFTSLRTCPKCHSEYEGIPAMSREDSSILICPDCGTREALESIGITGEEQDKIIGIIHDVHKGQ